MANNSDTITAPNAAMTPVGINHLVLNVRNMEESHTFWTEIMGFKQVGELHPRPDVQRPKMRFYSGDHDGKLNHHDLALVEMPSLPPPPQWSMSDSPLAINHIAIALPNREAWLKQLAFLQSRGVPFHRRVNHGMTHSLYINDPNGYGIEVLYELPREVWEGGLCAAVDPACGLAAEGGVALVDDRDNVPVLSQPESWDRSGGVSTVQVVGAPHSFPLFP